MSLTEKVHSKVETAQITHEHTKALLKEIDRLKAELATMTKDRDDWKREWEMYANAWKRELGNKLFNKRHLIDALVLTTRHLQKNFETWEAETKAMQERRRVEDIAKTLGWSGPLPEGAGR